MIPRTDKCPRSGADERAWFDRLDQAAQSLHADAAPPESLRVRARSASTMATVSTPVTTRATPLQSRRALVIRGAALAAACAAAVGGIAALLFSPGSLVRALPAFAQVQAAMGAVRTAHWTEVQTSYDAEGKETTRSTSERWARLTPPALAERTELTDVRAADIAARTVMRAFRRLQQADSEITYDPQHDRYTRDPSWPYRIAQAGAQRDRALREYILRQLVLPPVGPAPGEPPPRLAPGEGMDFLGADWKVTHTTLNGQPADLFEREYVPPARPNWRRYLATRVWADPTTRRVLRREQRYWHTPDGSLSYLTVAENFRYDQTPPPGTFALAPPPGANVVTRGGSIWDRLTPVDRRAIQEAITRSEEGWRQADFDRFVSAWDFNYPRNNLYGLNPGPPRRRMWKIRVQNQKGRWAEWRSEVAAVTANGDMPSMAILTARVRSRGRWGDNGQTWRGEAAYVFLRGRDGKPRIVDWQHQNLWDRLLAEH
jgi:hypothetical protein